MKQNIIYIRTSTEEQNPQNQLKDCESINHYGTPLIVEEKESAYKNKDRPNFNEVIKLIKQNKVEHLIVWDWDRLFRNRKKLKEFFEFCKIYKCNIHSFRQKFFEDFYKIPKPFDEIIQELVLNLMGWMAEDESKKKSERVKSAVRKKKGKTISYKGNKWGRKNISTQKINKIEEYYKNNPQATIRKIAQEVGISKSVVHKYIQEIKRRKE